ncbi:hypothetical protein GCM10011342_21140 [Aquisalinus flavus]|uniref:Uncharacterized protein n=2 Tax=Aquisalinus flavus TaxID=1526572 RepID=A0A8J2V7N3_9PROT|nr:hypothetical protein [Aquisalinus flavus]MBD0425930.1 hypothetical protein [Aquisalinus flavus]UNE48476.1 hypothetical protein FF099_10665 [Aquisalinus flavus]GGD12123.1 hypothetical protein GCM10011342_21140 [Aquisalinus flavus]
MRLIPVLFIAFAVAVSVGAINAIAQSLGFGVDAWYGPLAVFNKVYLDLLENAFGGAMAMIDNRFGITIPVWTLHAAVLYLGAALAFVSGTTGVATRERIMENVKATALGVIVPLAIPVFIWHVFRMGLVSRFARDNSLSFMAYALLVAGAYFASVFANNRIYAPDTEAQVQEASISAEEISAMGAMAEPGRRDGATRIGTNLVAHDPGADSLARQASFSVEQDQLSPEYARVLGETLGRNLHERAELAPARGDEIIIGTVPTGLVRPAAAETE